MIAGRMLKQVLRKARCDIVPYTFKTHPLARRMHLLATAGVNVVLDAGANVGQYGRIMRDAGYRGRIISFEPLTSAHARLVREASGDAMWETRNFALGDFDGSTEINISCNSHSSSILEMLPRHVESEPSSRYVGRETVAVRRLDSIVDELFGPAEIPFLKLDTQGYERPILAGAVRSLPRLAGAQLELSRVHLYDGDSLFSEIISLMEAAGFVLMALESGFSDSVTGQLLQVEGVFFRDMRPGKND